MLDRFLPLILLALVAGTITVVVWKFSMTMLLARYGGCRTTLLEQCPKSIQQLRARMGLLLLVVVAVSSVMAGMAWNTVTSRVEIGIAVGIAWFILFSVVDSVLMGSLDGVSISVAVANETRTAKFRRLASYWAKRIALYAMRLAIIGVIAHFNAKAVNLVIYEPEIEQVIMTNNAERLKGVAEKRALAREAFGKFQTGWEDWLTKERDVREKWRDEGIATRVAEIEATIKRKEAEYMRLRENGVEARTVASAEADYVATVEANAKPIGMADRDAILGKLGENNPFIPLMYWMFVLIEAIAFLIKMMKDPDAYDYLVTKEREQAKRIVLHPDEPAEFEDTHPPAT